MQEVPLCERAAVENNCQGVHYRSVHTFLPSVRSVGGCTVSYLPVR